MRKVLVTGGSGFIGSHLVDRLVEKGYKVTIFDNLEKQVHPFGLPEYHNLKAKFIRGDVRKKNVFKDAVKNSDIVVHLAAAVGVGQSQYQIAKYVETNIQGTANLLDILVNEKHTVKKLLVASSMSIYGEGLYLCGKCGKVKPPLRDFAGCNKEKILWEPLCPYCRGSLKPVATTEDTPLMSNSIYAISKKEQEEMSLMIGKTYGIPVTALRFFNVYGPRQSLSNPYTGVAAIFLSRIKNGNPPVVYEDGLQTRDFIWVGDIVEACILSLEKEQANYQVFNVGSGIPISIVDIAKILIRLLGIKNLEPAITCKFRKGDIRHCYADTRKIKKIIGFEPKVPFEQGLKKLIRWSKTVKSEDRFAKASDELKKKGLI